MTGELNWKRYRWDMSTVWLENVLSKQPARWLPPGYSDYGALLTAAMESALKQSDVPADLAQWKWGENYSGGDRSSRAGAIAADRAIDRTRIAIR